MSHPHSSQSKHAHPMTVVPFKHFNVQFICSFFILGLELPIRLVKRCELVHWYLLVALWPLVERCLSGLFLVDVTSTHSDIGDTRMGLSGRAWLSVG